MDAVGAIAWSVYVSPGARTVALRVTDNRGAAALTSATLNIMYFDSVPPTIEIKAPFEGALYSLNQDVAMSFGCTDNLAELASCDASTGGATVDTSSPGEKTFRVIATDQGGNTAEKVVQYHGTRSAVPRHVVLQARMNTTRYFHTLTVLRDGRVLAAGGFAPPVTRNETEIYDPATNGWTLGTSLLTPRLRHTATLLADGRVFVTGSSSERRPEIYDPSSNTWTFAAPMSRSLDWPWRDAASRRPSAGDRRRRLCGPRHRTA